MVTVKADSNCRCSNRNPFDLIERDLVACAIIELRCARTFVRGHELGVFERAAGLKVGGNSSGAEGVAADLDLRAKVGGAALDHAPGVDPVHRRGRERPGAPDGRAEQGALVVAGDAGSTNVLIEEGFELDSGWDVSEFRGRWDLIEAKLAA